MTEYPYMVLSCEDGVWVEDTIFKTVDDAKHEIREIVKVMNGTVSHGEYVIVPNNFDILKAFRPLDMGDAIYTGKPKGNYKDHLIDLDWWKREGLK